jgi:hypothetical protein
VQDWRHDAPARLRRRTGALPLTATLLLASGGLAVMPLVIVAVVVAYVVTARLAAAAARDAARGAAGDSA